MPKPFTSNTFQGYQIEDPPIGRGKTSVVHKAKTSDGKNVAIKFLKPPGGNTAFFADLFKKEYQTLVSLSAHPYIAKVTNFGFANDQFYIVSEFIEGKPLAQYLRGKKPVEMIPLFVQTLEGLNFIHHNGLIHLDVKSENVLVTEKGGKPEIRIIDFGIARTPLSYKGEMIGSISYMAPEVALGLLEKVDARSDLFSFAVLMYYCITWGDMPSARSKIMDLETLRRIIEKENLPAPPSSAHADTLMVPEFLDKIVLRLLAKDPGDRFYGNARAVINALSTKTPDTFRNAPEELGPYLIPEGNTHIGREKDQDKIFSLVDDFIKMKNFQPPILVIEGTTGLGKTHLLEKISNHLLKNVESISLVKLSFPADGATCHRFVEEVGGQIHNKKKLMAIIIDDIHEATYGNEDFKKACELLSHLADFIDSKNKNPNLYLSQQPIFICIALNNQCLSTEKTLDALGINANCTLRTPLEPLTYLDLYSYLKSTPALKDRQIPGEWLETLHSRTGGNPLLIREHLQEIDAKNMLFDVEGNIVLSPVMAREPGLPPPMIKTRFEEILNTSSRIDKEILQLFSVWNWQHLAPPIKFDDIAALLPISYLNLKLEDLIAREILVYDIGVSSYELKNRDYFSSLIYESMPEEDRANLHGKVASYLKMRKVGEYLLLLHSCYSPQTPATFHSILKLGRKFLVQKGDVHIARNLFERGVKLAGPSNANLAACFCVHMMEACQQEGKYARAEDIYKHAVALLEKNDGGPWKSTLSLRMLDILIHQRRFDEAQSLLNLMPQIKIPFSPFTLQLMNYRARMLYETGNNEAAKEIYQKTESLENLLPLHAKARVKNNNLGLVFLRLGEYRPAIVKLGEKLAKLKKEGNIFGIIPTMLAICEAYRMTKNSSAAASIAQQATDLAIRTNQFRWLLHAHNALANIAHDEDRFEEALKHDDACLACSIFIEDREEYKRSSAVIWTRKGHCYKELGRYDMALMNFSAALETQTSPTHVMSAHEGIGEIMFKTGNFAESLEHLNIAEGLLNSVSSDTYDSHRLAIQKLKAKISKAQQGEN